MRRKVSAFLVLPLLILLVFTAVNTYAMTEVGTPRRETLIVETQTPTDVPGQFNSYMQGTQMGFGIHQLMSAMMWEMDTITGEQFGEVAAGAPESNRTYCKNP